MADSSPSSLSLDDGTTTAERRGTPRNRKITDHGGIRDMGGGREGNYGGTSSRIERMWKRNGERGRRIQRAASMSALTCINVADQS